MKSYLYEYKKNAGKVIIIIAIVAVFAVFFSSIVGSIILKETIRAPEITEISQLYSYPIGSVVRLTTDLYAYTGFVDTKNKKEVASYYFVALDGILEFAIVRSSKKYYNDEEGKIRTFTGKVELDPYHSENVESLATQGRMSAEDAEKILIDVQINEAYDKGHFFLLIIPGGLVLICWMLYYLGLRKNKKNQKILMGLSDLETVDAAIAKAYEEESFTKYGKLFISKDWLYNKAIFNFYLFPATEVIWTYMSVTSHRYNGVPTVKTYACYFFMTDGTSLIYNGTQRDIEEMLDFAEQNWPAYVGFNEQLRETFNAKREILVNEWNA